MHVTFETANKRAWSNPHLDLLEGTQLLIEVYRSRPEAAAFVRRIDDAQAVAEPLAAHFGAWAAPYQRTLVERGFGRDRRRTAQSLGGLLDGLLPEVIRLASDAVRAGHPAALAWIADPAAMAWLSKLGQLTAADGPMGGRLTIGLSWRLRARLFLLRVAAKLPWPRWQPAAPLQPDSAVVGTIAFVRDVVDACWDAGLKSALAPIAVILPVLSAWGSGNLGAKAAGQATLDGLLGPLFLRQITTAVKPGPGGTKRYPEWRLIGMGLPALRQEIGTGHYRAVKQRIEAFGYHDRHRWDEDDFHMLFDRLYLRRSVVAIADRHGLSPEAAQDRTAKLARLLGLDLPRARRTRDPLHAPS